MLKRICLISSAIFTLLIFTNTSFSQEAHVGLFISTPHVQIVGGEPVYWPYYHPHYYYHHRSYLRGLPYYHSYYYPHRYYYGYRHDNGRHRGWHKHRW